MCLRAAELRQTQKAAIRVLVTLARPTPGMHDAANHAGTYTWPISDQPYPKIQMVTVADLLAGTRPQMPPTLTPYIAAKRLRPPRAEQTGSLGACAVSGGRLRAERG